LIHKDTLFSFLQNLFIWKSVSDNDSLLNEKKANKNIENFKTKELFSGNIIDFTSLIDKKKISGILQEVIFAKDKRFLITGIGINIKKNPIIRNYPATNLHEVTKKSISKLSVENKLKLLFEKNLS